MAGYPYAMAPASASVQFPIPYTGRGPLHAIWETDTASIQQDLPNPYDRSQRTPAPPHAQQLAGPTYQITPPLPSTNRPHTFYAANPRHVASSAPEPSIRQPRSMLDMGASHSRALNSAAGDYFSHTPSARFPQPQIESAPPLRHARSSPPPVPHKPNLDQPPIPVKSVHSFPVLASRHTAPHPYAHPTLSQNSAPHATAHTLHAIPPSVPHPPHAVPRPQTAAPHHHHHHTTPPTSSRHRHVDSSPNVSLYPRTSSPKPELPPKPPANDEEFRRAMQVSLQESQTHPQYDEDAALAQALRESLVDARRPPPRHPSSFTASSSSGHSTDSGSNTSSSRVNSPYASPRPSSSAPHPAFFPGHRSLGSSAANTPLTSPNPGDTVDTAQALRMRSSSIETVLPQDVRQRIESANKNKPLPLSAPSTSRIPHASPVGQAKLTKRTAHSQSDLGHAPQASRRLSVAVEATPRETARSGESELTPVLDTLVVESPSPRQQNFTANDELPTYPSSGPAMIDEKHGLSSMVSTIESDSSGMSSAQKQLIPQELLTGISMGFGTAPIVPADSPYQDTIPTLISLPYGDKAPFYIQGPNWRSVLKFMARLPATRVEPSLDALKKLKGEARLRLVVSFVKVHSTSSEWLAGVYMSIDVPVPVNAPNAARFRSGDSSMVPWSYTMSSAPAVMRDGADGPLSKFYTIPSVPGNLYPTLPTTFPDLAMYLASALELSRNGPLEGYPGLRRLSKLVDTLYPEDRGEGLDVDEKRGMRERLKSFVGLGSKPQRSRNAEMYDLVTPFVPDDYGR
ncbi:hypothetical protein DAEQUDRAFT_720441 [Daedalea quercina L-15889]|uniref:Uncharacterized protein n=1 Tax=Daedalea quercina L-15889 TaxID=1314783 RepID=A0A165U230_9APHY|nr:hypothetical protein DAEQUDRAFT_720441 [Daedalea quercina L-15889]